MKILKLLSVFVVLVVGIFLLTQWKTLFGGEEEIVLSDPINVNEKCNEIRNAWAKEENWNHDLFTRQLADIKQKHKLKRFESEGDFETVNNTLRESATNCLNTGIFREFHSATCDDALVRKNYDGVSELVSAFSMDGDSRIKNIKQTKALYDKITAFIKSPHTITAKFNSSENSWTSFDVLSRSVINTAQNYRGNTIYKEHLSNIKRFIDGLSDSHIRSVVNGQEDGFYRSLSSQIINHFNGASLTEANLARYNNAYDKYSRETTRYSSAIASDLRIFRKRYDAEQEKNKKSL